MKCTKYCFLQLHSRPYKRKFSRFSSHFDTDTVFICLFQFEPKNIKPSPGTQPAAISILAYALLPVSWQQCRTKVHSQRSCRINWFGWLVTGRNPRSRDIIAYAAHADMSVWCSSLGFQVHLRVWLSSYPAIGSWRSTKASSYHHVCSVMQMQLTSRQRLVRSHMYDPQM